MTSDASLIGRLAAWDGRTVGELRALADEVSSDDHAALFNALTCGDDITERAASWVVKARYEAGDRIPFPGAALAGEPHWEVALHLLQSVQYLDHGLDVALFVPWLDHHRATVRAWALDAYVRQAAPDASERLAAAANDASAAVRARARQLGRFRG